MATFGQVLEDVDTIVSNTASVQNSWETDKRAAYAAIISRLMNLANDLQRQEALLRTMLKIDKEEPWWYRKWRIHHEATLEVMAMLGIKPIENENDLLL